jgi:plastocyanin
VIGAVAAVASAAIAAVPVGVGAREYRFGVYRTAVPAGNVRFNLHDFGEDAHNLQVRGPHGYRSAISPDVVPGRDVAFQVRLRKRGVYQLICVKPGHAARGMRATIRVR